MADAVGWKQKSAETYISKHYKAYLQRLAPATYRVLPEFKRVHWDYFQELVTQVRHPFAVYDRATYSNVVVYEFLMPLTREDKLRRALDELFYRDTLERRINEVGLEVFERVLPRNSAEGDGTYVDRVVTFIDERIGGFSISHVGGRFRGGPILSRAQAGEKLASDQPYLIDETTAVVRFIIPCLSSRSEHATEFELELGDGSGQLRQKIAAELQQIRVVFFEVFVEALVPSIRGEKLIWMLEWTADGQRLYELSLATERGRDGDGSDDGDDDDDSD